MSKPIPEAMVRRLNRMMSIIQIKPMTIKELYGEIELGRRSMLTHVRKLLDDGKIVQMEGPGDRRNKVYKLAQGAMPFKFESTVKPDQEPKKRGPKPGTKKSVAAEVPKVKTVPAQQVGMARDPLVAMLFG